MAVNLCKCHKIHLQSLTQKGVVPTIVSIKKDKILQALKCLATSPWDSVTWLWTSVYPWHLAWQWGLCNSCVSKASRTTLVWDDRYWVEISLQHTISGSGQNQMHPFHQRKRSTQVHLNHCKSDKSIGHSERSQGTRTLTPKLSSPKFRNLCYWCHTNPANLTRSQYTTTLYPFRLNIISHKNASWQLSCPENPQGKFRNQSKRDTHQKIFYRLRPWAWHTFQWIPRPLWW